MFLKKIVHTMLPRGEKITPKMHQNTSQNYSKMPPGTPRGPLGTHMESSQILGPLKMPLFRPQGPPRGPQEGHFENGFAPRAPLGPPSGPSGGLKKKNDLPGSPKSCSSELGLERATIFTKSTFSLKNHQKWQKSSQGGLWAPLGAFFENVFAPGGALGPP